MRVVGTRLVSATVAIARFLYALVHITARYIVILYL